MRRNVIPWPCEPASSIAVVAAFCLAFFALPSIPVMAQTVLVPDPLPFDAFVESQLPGLTVARDKAFPSGIFRLSLDDPRRKMLAVDSHTGLVIPDSPFPPMELLPKNDPRTREYSQKLREFLERREQLLQLRVQYLNLLGDKRRLELQNAAALNHNDYFSAKVTKWNGDIFWAPASKTTDVIIRFGDEVRSVLGPIPPFDVTTLGTRTTPDGSTITTATLVVEVEGNRTELKPNTCKPGSPLEFEHRDDHGNFVKWTATIDQCDKPSLAGDVTPCGTGSRLSRRVKGNVEWIALARKTQGVAPLTADPYWKLDNPSFNLLGYIGFNRVSGEVAFFDGSYSGITFNWNAPTVAPGGSGYGDDQGRAQSSQTYDATFKARCVLCHDNKVPRIITPHIGMARVGYRDPDRAAAFSLKDLLPQLPRGKRDPYRVVGGDFTALDAPIIASARTIVDPTGNCTSCHGITNNETGIFASDAVAQFGSLGTTPVPDSYRTGWALRTVPAKFIPGWSPARGTTSQVRHRRLKSRALTGRPSRRRSKTRAQILTH